MVVSLADISDALGVPTVAPDVRAPDDYENVQAKAGAGLEAVGAGLGKVSQFWGQVQTDGAVNEAMDQVNATLDHFKSLHGADALNAQADTQAQIASAFSQQRALLHSPDQQLEFDQSTRTYQQRYIAGQIASHADEEARAHATQVTAASQNLAFNNIAANPTDEQVFRDNLEDARQAAYRTVQVAGNSSDPNVVQAALQGANRDAWRSRILALAPNDPVTALKLTNANQSDLGELYGPLAEKLTVQARDHTADALVSGIAPLPGAAPTGPVSALVQSTATDLGVDPVQAQTVSFLESRSGTVPDRPGSVHTGPYQLSGPEFAAGGGTTRGDAGQEVKAGISVLNQARPVADAAVGGASTPWQQYLVFQQGKAGGTALLKADPSMNVVDALAPAYGGNKRQAMEAISQNGGSPASTVGEFTGSIAARYAQGEQAVRGGMLTQHAYPDIAGLESKVISATAGDPDLQQTALSKLHERVSVLNVQADAAKQQLSGTLDGINAALLSGDTSVVIPEQTIRAAMPAPEADRLVANLNDSKQAGLLIKGLRWAPPDQVASTMADLSTPDGTLAKTIRGHDLGGAPDGNALPPETPDQTLRRQRIAQLAQSALTDRDRALSTDPAGYVQANPAVATALQTLKANQGDPGAVQNYYATSLAAQQRLGVPSWDQHVLTAPEAARLAAQMNNADPGKVDVGALLDGQAKTYGSYWPQAFRDLVTVGKLDPRYQVLASMDAPGQVLARADYQRAIQAQATKAGGKDARSDVPDEARKDIDTGLDDALSDFRATAAVPGVSGNSEMLGNVRNSVRTLADYYATQGIDGADALKRATDGILNQKYDFDGTIRAPKGTLSQVERVTDSTLSNLKPADIQVASNDPVLGPMRQADLFRAVQRAKWVPNEGDDGLVAVAPLNNGAMWPVRLANGQRLELKFANLGRPQPISIGGAPPSPAPASGGSYRGLPYAPRDAGAP